MPFVEPTSGQFKQLSQMTDQGPIVMINLLKFKPDGGYESFQKYAATAGRLVRQVGGRQVYLGQGIMPFIGDEDWDMALLVEYPSIPAFLNMVGMEEYQQAVHFRSEALTDSRLYVTKPVM